MAQARHRERFDRYQEEQQALTPNTANQQEIFLRTKLVQMMRELSRLTGFFDTTYLENATQHISSPEIFARVQNTIRHAATLIAFLLHTSYAIFISRRIVNHTRGRVAALAALPAFMPLHVKEMGDSLRLLTDNPQAIMADIARDLKAISPRLEQTHLMPMIEYEMKRLETLVDLYPDFREKNPMQEIMLKDSLENLQRVYKMAAADKVITPQELEMIQRATELLDKSMLQGKALYQGSPDIQKANDMAAPQKSQEQAYTRGF